MKIHYIIGLYMLLGLKLLADGMSFHNGHVAGAYTAINFNDAQKTSVESVRRITLTDKQHAEVQKVHPEIPKTLEVMTIQESSSDCTCFVTNVLVWTGENRGEIPHNYLRGNKSTTNRHAYSIFVSSKGMYYDSNGPLALDDIPAKTEKTEFDYVFIYTPYLTDESAKNIQKSIISLCVKIQASGKKPQLI